MTDAAVATRAVLRDLRAARRRRRIADLDRFEALYRVYLTAIVSSVAVVLLAGLTGDTKVGHATVVQVTNRGPQWVGLAVALAWAVGLRSGGRGGPLVVEEADVRHVLLAPLRRQLVLRGPAVRQLRFGALVGAGVGAVAGLLAHQRLPGAWAAWVAAGAATGVLVTVGALGLAMVASGRRVGRLVGSALALAIVGWSVGDVLGRVTTSPATLVGELACWPLRVRLDALGGVAFAAAAAVVGVLVVGGCSLEAAERRAGLVGQIRFAATLQDLRTVVVLRRQLAQEQPRRRPWLQLPRSLSPGTAMAAAAADGAGAGGGGGELSGHGGPAFRPRRLPVWRRGWHGALRFPALRVARLVVLAGLAGVTMVGVWHGTTSLVVVAALAVYLIGLDAAEPLAQELDHPDRQEGFPVTAGELHIRHLGAPAVLCILLGLVGVAAAEAVAGGGTLAAGVGFAVVLPAALGGLAGAALSVVNGPPPAYSTQAMLSPEFAGIKVVIRLLLPILVALAGVLPVVAARQAARHGGHPVAVAVGVGVPALVVVAAAAGWVRYHQEIRRWWEEQMEATKQAARSPGGTGSGR